jgi:hypothetical protein
MVKPYRLKQQRLRAIAGREARMSPGNGKQQTLSPEQIAMQIAQQRMMQAAYAAQQRQSIAVACLSGILSGLYSNPELLQEELVDDAINDAVTIADKLHARLVKDAQANLQASQPQPEKPAGGDALPETPQPQGDPQPEPEKSANDSPATPEPPPAGAGDS